MTSPATPQRDSDRVRVPPVTTTPRRRHTLKRRNTVFRAAALMSLYNSPLAPGVKPACKARKKGKPKRQENTTSKYGTTCVLCFGGLDPQKQGHLQKKGSFGFQVYVIFIFWRGGGIGPYKISMCSTFPNFTNKRDAGRSLIPINLFLMRALIYTNICSSRKQT